MATIVAPITTPRRKAPSAKPNIERRVSGQPNLFRLFLIYRIIGK